MNNNELLFYNEYESFYHMAEHSPAFGNFCKDAFGADLSQDGFSDIRQIDRILKLIPGGKEIHILDVGCGNGKMLGYLQKRTQAYIHGFDYSANAINAAKKLFQKNSDFRQGIIGGIDYPPEQFDLISSMDTMYFAPDMETFLLQLIRWLKPDGVLFVCYQEGDVMPKTEDAYTSVLAQALRKNRLRFEVEDITKETYELMKRKRESALLHQKDFEAEGNTEWFDLLMLQTDFAAGSFEEFAVQMARYIYIVRKADMPHKSEAAWLQSRRNR